MEKRKAAFHNLGCKVNAYETEAMQQILENAGYEIVPFTEIADVYVINTCSVTNMADRKSRQMFHRAKKMNPDAVVVAAGCYVQAAAEEAAADEAIDIIIGNNQKRDLVKILENFKKLGRNNIGQEQYWVLFYFYGEDSEIDFATHPEEIEFKAYEWVDISEAPQRIVPFKKDVYQNVAKAFQPYIRKKNGKNWSLSKEMILQHKMEDIRIYSRYRER